MTKAKIFFWIVDFFAITQVLYIFKNIILEQLSKTSPQVWAHVHLFKQTFIEYMLL